MTGMGGDQASSFIGFNLNDDGGLFLDDRVRMVLGLAVVFCCI